MQVLASLLLLKLPAHVPGEETDMGPTAWVTITRIADLCGGTDS